MAVNNRVVKFCILEYYTNLKKFYESLIFFLNSINTEQLVALSQPPHIAKGRLEAITTLTPLFTKGNSSKHESSSLTQASLI